VQGTPLVSRAVILSDHHHGGAMEFVFDEDGK
jgi:hypothetical protein